jgi:hypothetical protein
MDNVIDKLKKLTIDLGDGKVVPAFSDVSEIIQKIGDRPESVALLQQQALKFEFGQIIGFICGFLAAHREMPVALRKRMETNSTEPGKT